MQTQERLHGMDNLRALAMLVGVVFHASLAHSPLLHPYFPTADRAQSPMVDVLAWGFHLFRMPLFFVVAGFFSALLLDKRGMGGLMRNRAQRIALPLLVLWPLLHSATSWLTVEAAQQVQHPSPLLVMVRTWLTMAAPPSVPPSTMHLWFLYYLLMFHALLWCAAVLVPLTLLRRLQEMPPWSLLLVLPLLLTPAFWMVSAPHPAPEGLLPQLWAVIVFGSFFSLGFGLFHRPDWLACLRGRHLQLLLACALLYVAFLALLEQQPVDLLSPRTTWPIALLEALLSVWLTLLALDAGQRLLNRQNAVLSYLSAASYTVYVLHLPILFAVQYRLMDWDAAWYTKLATSLVATLLASLAAYQLLVRHSPLRRFL